MNSVMATVAVVDIDSLIHILWTGYGSMAVLSAVVSYRWTGKKIEMHVYRLMENLSLL